MKNLLTSIFLISFLPVSFCQNVEWSANLKFTDEAHLAFVNSAGEYLIAEGGSYWSFGQPSFFVLDETGNLVTEQFFDNVSFENGTVQDILELPDGDILILGNGGLCDVCCWGSVQRHDANWNPYWTNGEPFEMTTFPSKIKFSSDYPPV